MWPGPPLPCGKRWGVTVHVEAGWERGRSHPIQMVHFSHDGLPRWLICLPAQETWVRSMGWEDLLKNETATYSSIPAGIIPWIGEPGGLQSIDSQRVRHDWALHCKILLGMRHVEWFLIYLQSIFLPLFWIIIKAVLKMIQLKYVSISEKKGDTDWEYYLLSWWQCSQSFLPMLQFWILMLWPFIWKPFPCSHFSFHITLMHAGKSNSFPSLAFPRLWFWCSLQSITGVWMLCRLMISHKNLAWVEHIYPVKGQKQKISVKRTWQWIILTTCVEDTSTQVLAYHLDFCENSDPGVLGTVKGKPGSVASEKVFMRVLKFEVGCLILR